MLTFVLGGLLGAIAGILITPLIAVDYTTGLPITLKGIAAAILAGFPIRSALWSAAWCWAWSNRSSSSAYRRATKTR